MSFEELVSLFLIFGVVLIVPTLVWLAVEVRQATQAFRSTAMQSATHQLSDQYNVLFEDQSFTEIFVKSFDAPTELSQIERARLNAWWTQSILNTQSWYMQMKSGAIDPLLFESYGYIFHQLVLSHSFQHFWQSRKEMFAPDFVAYVESMADEESTRQFRPLGVEAK